MVVQFTLVEMKDGEEFADVNVSLLTRQEAHDLRYELTQQLLEHPEQFQDEDKRIFYHKKIEQIKAFLGTD